jgi:hypothetical protein
MAFSKVRYCFSLDVAMQYKYPGAINELPVYDVLHKPVAYPG